MGFKYIAKQADDQGIIHFTDEEHETWQILITRQKKIIEPYACQAFLDGIDILQMAEDRVPQCHDINQILQKCTGWSVVPVPALIPQKKFFELLANRQFPAASFIRIREELDYLQEPDIFHEYFGHCPLLTQPAYADFVHWYGTMALQTDSRTQKLLARLFWFTIEFGLLKENNEFKIYGGGILSSKEETIYAATSTVPHRVPFDTLTCIRTPYRYDLIQSAYFYLNHLNDLYQLRDLDLPALAAHANIIGDLEPSFNIC